MDILLFSFVFFFIAGLEATLLRSRRLSSGKPIEPIDFNELLGRLIAVKDLLLHSKTPPLME